MIGNVKATPLLRLGLAQGLGLVVACAGAEEGGAPAADDQGTTEIRSVDLAVNERPCGEATIAVVTRPEGSTYAFCTLPREGLFAFELLPTAAEPGLLDAAPDALSLLHQVVPEGQAIPGWVEESLSTGVKLSSHEPWRVVAEGTTVGQRRFALEGSCNDPDTFFADADGHLQNFVGEFVNFNPGAGWTIYDCVDEVRFRHEGWGTSIRTASGQPETSDGTCGMYGRVLGCGASHTLLEAMVRDRTDSGSFSNFFTFWIPAGGFGKVKGYSNGLHSCNPSHNRDDYRIEIHSAPNSFHHFAGIYIGRAKNNVRCDINPN